MLLGNAAKASEILAELDKAVPGIIMVKLRRINLGRRRKHFDVVVTLYQEAMVETSDQELATFFAIRYSRFLAKVCMPLYNFLYRPNSILISLMHCTIVVYKVNHCPLTFRNG